MKPMDCDLHPDIKNYKKPIVNIALTGVDGYTGSCIYPEHLCSATIMVNVRISKDKVEKYLQKELSANDLVNFINDAV